MTYVNNDGIILEELVKISISRLIYFSKMKLEKEVLFMPRPMKWRNVCRLPFNNRFGPLDVVIDENNYINMRVDEYEVIRLIDLEGFTQEECAEQLNVARTTVQSIYIEARKKLADALVNSKMLLISGGKYQLCDGLGNGCGRGCQLRRGNGNRNRNILY